MEIGKENPEHTTQDRPLDGALSRLDLSNRIIVDVALDWPEGDCVGSPYTPPLEDYQKVVEASLGVPVPSLGEVAMSEIDRIYYDGLCGGGRGHTRKMIPFKNWVAYVVKCLWQAYEQGLLYGCCRPRSVYVGR